ncbi:unnamed protein product [Durusdinium trenchii]|uniref:Uncharacterized protein n=1 Tax=Durusdinium trenchii TaxID=1381693 RepID=A0ABP0S0D7_9DINO
MAAGMALWDDERPPFVPVPVVPTLDACDEPGGLTGGILAWGDCWSHVMIILSRPLLATSIAALGRGQSSPKLNSLGAHRINTDTVFTKQESERPNAKRTLAQTALRGFHRDAVSPRSVARGCSG